MDTYFEKEFTMPVPQTSLKEQILTQYKNHSYEYLLLLVLPNVIIIARGLRFLRKYWMKELGFWVIIFSLLAYKAATFF